ESRSHVEIPPETYGIPAPTYGKRAPTSGKIAPTYVIAAYSYVIGTRFQVKRLRFRKTGTGGDLMASRRGGEMEKPECIPQTKSPFRRKPEGACSSRLN